MTGSSGGSTVVEQAAASVGAGVCDKGVAASPQPQKEANHRRLPLVWHDGACEGGMGSGRACQLGADGRTTAVMCAAEALRRGGWEVGEEVVVTRTGLRLCDVLALPCDPVTGGDM